jgi:3-deoxy-D-manno-octulosonic-acid transferase
MPVLYDAALRAYRMAAQVLAWTGSAKARKFVAGRQGLIETIEAAFRNETRPVIWMHCASLGEFEQGRPVLETLRQRHPEYAFVLTFFSPSGYEVRKSYPGADYVFYLPHDTPENARRFVAAVKPRLALMVKYDLWLHYLEALQQARIPTVLFAARFTSRQGFFRWYGGIQRRMIRLLDWIFVQDEASQKLLLDRGLERVTVAGDTRFDRVAEAARFALPHPELTAFAAGAPLLIAGSTWPADEALLAQIIPELLAHWKLVIVPHEVGEAHLQQVEALFKAQTVRWSQGANSNARILLVDQVGLLLQLYRSAAIAYVGGGFGKAGIHNVLEPAAMGVPVIHGPVFHQFLEAQALIDAGGSLTISDPVTLQAALLNWMQDEATRQTAGRQAAGYVQAHTGATETIVRFLDTRLAER